MALLIFFCLMMRREFIGAGNGECQQKTSLENCLRTVSKKKWNSMERGGRNILVKLMETVSFSQTLQIGWRMMTLCFVTILPVAIGHHLQSLTVSPIAPCVIIVRHYVGQGCQCDLFFSLRFCGIIELCGGACPNPKGRPRRHLTTSTHLVRRQACPKAQLNNNAGHGNGGLGGRQG